MKTLHSWWLSSSQAKKMLLKLGVFMLLLFILDQGIGKVFHKVFFMQPSGKFHRMTQTIERSTDQLMIFGSSHATRHYDPLILEDLLGIPCYNSGVQGRGILFIRAVQKMMLTRHHPKTIILNIDPRMLFAREDNYDRLSDLLPYYKKHPEVHSILHLRSNFEQYKLLSNLYAYNSTIVHIIKYQLFNQFDQKGYRPHKKSIDPNTYQSLTPKNTISKLNPQLDPNNVKALEAFLYDAKKVDIEVIAVISPTYYGGVYSKDESFIKIREILKKESIELWDYSNSANYINKAPLFYDEHHLNINGARIFSKEIANRLKIKWSDNEEKIIQN